MRARLEANLAAVRVRIADAAAAANRPVDSVRLLAVTKYVSPPVIAELGALGQVDVAENYVQRGLAKQDALASDALRWHLIGPLQTNKVRKVVGRFAAVQTVDRVKLARRLGEVAAELGAELPVMLQVNTSGEAAKSGCAPDEVGALADAIVAHEALALVGLMTMGPTGGGPEAARPCFAQLRELRDRLAERLADTVGPLELSMGMSGDLEVAVAEGATVVRVGSALYEGLDDRWTWDAWAGGGE